MRRRGTWSDTGTRQGQNRREPATQSHGSHGVGWPVYRGQGNDIPLEVDIMYGHTIRRWALAALAVACAGGAQAQTAGPLTIDLEAAGTFTRSHEWSIDKRVTPASADRFIGDTQQFAYMLQVT